MIDAPNKYGFSPLMTACSHGDVALVELLLTSGANVEFQNENGYSRFVCGCGCGCGWVCVGVGGCMSESLCIMKIRSDRERRWGYITNRENHKN